MNNEEKKQFLLNAHRLLMEIRPYNENLPLAEKKRREDLMWLDFKNRFCGKQPKHLYKYRNVDNLSIDSLENDYAWFSHPIDFGDMVDSTLNTDVEAEIEEFEKDSKPIVKKIAVAIINYWLAPYGQKVNEELVDKVIPLFGEDGQISEADTRGFMLNQFPQYASDNNIKKLLEATQPDKQEATLDSVRGFFETYIDFNNRIRKETFAFCLAEESDNLAMWETYANNAKGFCIEYEIPDDTFLGQRILMNLLPMYYGEREFIKFFDVLVRGLTSKKQINGVSYEDYEKWFLSVYTKNETYSFQKEWRVVFTADMGGNKQPFPFIKSIILGEKISDENKAKLIEIAKSKGYEVYQRKPNISGSRIIVTKL